MKLIFSNNFIGYFKFYYRIIGNRMLVYFILSITVSLLDGMGLAMFMPLLQAVSGSPETTSESLGQFQYIIDGMKAVGMELNVNTVLIVLVVLFCFKGIVKFIQLKYAVKLKHYFISKVRNHLVTNLQGLTFNGFLKLDGGKIQNTLTNEVNRLFLTMNFYFNAAQAAVMLGTYVFLALLANYQFALMVALGAGLSNLIYRRIYAVTKKASYELSEKGNDFNGFLIQAVHYFKYLKSTNYFSIYSKKLRNVIKETEYLNRKIGSYNSIVTSVKEPIIVIIVALVIMVQVNFMGSSLTSILLSLLLFYRALAFLVSLQNYWQGFIENSGGMKSVAAISEDMAKLQEKQGTKVFESLSNAIEITDVEFSYGPNKVLNGTNVHIPRRQTIAFVGESGSGKTTIANMISGLVVPDKGKLLIDKVPMSEYNLGDYRNKIGYISQESVIFSDTIYNNITFWAEPTPENLQRFNEIIELASLREFVDLQPEKEHTRLGDNGILISGGQKQRISIARELFKSAEILIFDEATSALDSETEKIIQDNIEDLHGRYTIIIIAHRLSTIRKADIIYLLEKGRVSASGSFDEMIDNSPRFKRMVSLQEF